MNTRFERNETKLRINALKYFMKGTEERLLFTFKDLLVFVGGFLGLFIGLSLNDVVTVTIYFFEFVLRKIPRFNE